MESDIWQVQVPVLTICGVGSRPLLCLCALKPMGSGLGKFLFVVTSTRVYVSLTYSRPTPGEVGEEGVLFLERDCFCGNEICLVRAFGALGPGTPLLHPEHLDGLMRNFFTPNVFDAF